MLRWIRPRWLREIARFMLPFVASIVIVEALFVIGGIVTESVPPFSAWSAEQQLRLLGYTLSIGWIAVGVLLLGWNWIRRRKRHHANAWYRKGVELAEQQRYAEALAAYERAIKIAPKFSNAWLSKGESLSQLGRHEEALAAEDHLTTLYPRFVVA